MIALLLAAQLSAAPAGPAPIGALPAPTHRCDMWMARPVDFRPGASRGPAPGPRTLAEMPPADEHLLVLRRDASGCSVPVIIRYSVQGDGRFAGGEGR